MVEITVRWKHTGNSQDYFGGYWIAEWVEPGSNKKREYKDGYDSPGAVAGALLNHLFEVYNNQFTIKILDE